MKEKPILFSGPMVRAILEGRKTQTRRLIKPQPPEWIKEMGWTAFTPKGHISGRGYWKGVPGDGEGPAEKFFKQPYKVGDILWVRESMRWSREGAYASYELHMRYMADNKHADMEQMPDGYCPPRNNSHTDNWGSGDDHLPEGAQWGFTTTYGTCPSLFMPRWASRITLEVTEVRAQRLNEISEEDAKAEGADVWPYDPMQPMTTGELGGEHPYRGGFAVLWDAINDHRATWKSNPWTWAYTFERLESK